MSKKPRTEVKDLPKNEKELNAADMKKVKGGAAKIIDPVSAPIEPFGGPKKPTTK